ncbi:MAG: hemolysin family protein [Flavobacteriales bacterium]
MTTTMDDPSSLLILLSIIATLVLSAFFSGMEIAFVSSNKLKIELDKKLGLLPAKVYSYFSKHQSKFISTLLLGNNIALVVYGIFMASLLENPLRRVLTFLPDESITSIVVLLIQTLISTLVILVFAEFLPKVIFRINPNRKLELFTLPVLIICAPLYSLVWLTFTFVGYLVRLASVEFQESEYSFGRIDLDHYVREAASSQSEESDLENELQIFQNALDFSSIKARECMIPRNEIEALDFEDSIEELRTNFIETGYSKILIYKENIDNVIGYVHSFELFQKPQAIKNILRPLAIVPETTTADKVLKTLIEQKKNVALVVDEYGGTSGMLTLEDIVEEIFGEIEDEHDQEELVEVQLSANEYLLSARLEIDYLNDEYDLKLPENEDYETLAGLIIYENEDLPEEGDEINIGGYTLEIKKVSDNKIDEVVLRPSESAD